MQIETSVPGVVLRPFTATDGPALVHHANNRNVSRFLRDAFPFPYTAADADAWLAAAADESLERKFAIACEGAVIGGIGLRRGFDVDRLSNEIGYWVGEPYWGRGIATASVRALSEWAFRASEIVRLWGGVFHTNVASGRVLEKAGYTFEARLRRSIVKEATILDQLIYARLRDCV